MALEEDMLTFAYRMSGNPQAENTFRQPERPLQDIS